MTAYDRLLRFVEDAPRGTLVPVDELRAILADAQVGAAGEANGARGLTAGEAADWLHRHLGGRKRTPAAVRKMMRTGLRGVVLQSFSFGRERRTTEQDLQRFLGEVRDMCRSVPRSVLPPGETSGALPPPRDVDPADEIAAAKASFRIFQPEQRAAGA
jgi:hypothetical protein